MNKFIFKINNNNIQLKNKKINNIIKMKNKIKIDYLF